MADLDRREQLMAALDAAEEGTLEAPIEKEIEVNEDPIEAENDSYEEASNEESHEQERDEKGRFKGDTEETSSQDDSVEEPELVAEASPEPEEELIRPTTWKKEYLPIWDKLTKGEQLSKEEAIKLAKYSNQRESEYKKGVSTYKSEADRGKPFIEAIAPVEQDLQRRGINPTNYVQSLIKADQILTHAPMENKVQIFQQLAREYGIQLTQDGIAPIQVDAYTQQLMNQLNRVNQEVSTIKGRFQMEEESRLNNEIERVRSDVERFPHFDVVREEMAQLLELGKAQDLETAYAKAVRLNDDVWAIEQERLLKNAQKQASKASQVAKAKAAAVSPKSVTPSGKVANSDDKKDRRSLIAEQMGEAMSRRV